jgi:hypothetical protein
MLGAVLGGIAISLILSLFLIAWFVLRSGLFTQLSED